MKDFFKLISLLFYALTYLSYRHKNVWAFGSGTGFDGNSKYLFQHINETHPSIKAFWITKRKNEVEVLRKKHLKAYYSFSLIGIYYSLIASKYVVTGSLADINFYTSGGAKYIQLWHGIGIKCALWSNKHSILNNTNRIVGFIKRPSFYIQPDFILGASEMMNKILAEMLNSDVSVVKSILYPRCVQLRKDKSECLKYIEKWEDKSMLDFVRNLSYYKKVVLYMPTYRDKDPHFLKEQDWDIETFNENLRKTNTLLIVKLHPHMINEIDFTKCSNIVEYNRHFDIYPLMPFTDALITDYSSIYYDYILMDNKQIILYIPDKDSYISDSRDLLMDYTENCKGDIALTFEELQNYVVSNKYNCDYYGLRQKFWGDILSTDCETLYNEIQRIK